MYGFWCVVVYYVLYLLLSHYFDVCRFLFVYILPCSLSLSIDLVEEEFMVVEGVLYYTDFENNR